MKKKRGGDDLGEKDATHIQTAFVFNCTTRWCWHAINDHWINGREALKNVVSQAGFEPATFPLGGGCSIQLSY